MDLETSTYFFTSIHANFTGLDNLSLEISTGPDIMCVEGDAPLLTS